MEACPALCGLGLASARMESTSTDCALFICSRAPPAGAAAWGEEPVMWGVTVPPGIGRPGHLGSQPCGELPVHRCLSSCQSQANLPTVVLGHILIPGNFAHGALRHASMPLRGRAAKQCMLLQLTRAEHSCELLQGKPMKCSALQGAVRRKRKQQYSLNCDCSAAGRAQYAE